MTETPCSDVALNWHKVLQVFVVLLTISPVLSGYTGSKTSKDRLSDQNLQRSPEFDDLSIREIQAKVGQTVLLPCTVRNLGDKVVSWIRTKDLHILTTGSHTFSTDSRFESVSSYSTNFWGLRLIRVRTGDTGRYECQVNTDPKMSLGINLTVASLHTQDDIRPSYKWSSAAAIKGPPEVHIREGAPATFSCEISASSPSSAAPAAQFASVSTTRAPIHWLHEGKQISFDVSRESGRGGISVETDYRDRNSVSRLRVAEVSPQDSGLYTCTQAAAKPSSVRLVVVEAEHTEAMQHDAPHSSTGIVQNSKLLYACWILIVMIL